MARRIPKKSATEGQYQPTFNEQAMAWLLDRAFHSAPWTRADLADYQLNHRWSARDDRRHPCSATQRLIVRLGIITDAPLQDTQAAV